MAKRVGYYIKKGRAYRKFSSVLNHKMRLESLKDEEMEFTPHLFKIEVKKSNVYEYKKEEETSFRMEYY